MSDTKATSESFARDIALTSIDLSKATIEGQLKECNENHLREVYQAALKTPGSRELSVEEAEQFIRPYESASDTLRFEIEKSIRSSKP
jgi:hypothetical protein